MLFLTEQEHEGMNVLSLKYVCVGWGEKCIIVNRDSVYLLFHEAEQAMLAAREIGCLFIYLFVHLFI